MGCGASSQAEATGPAVGQPDQIDEPSVTSANTKTDATPALPKSILRGTTSAPLALAATQGSAATHNADKAAVESTVEVKKIRPASDAFRRLRRASLVVLVASDVSAKRERARLRTQTMEGREEHERKRLQRRGTELFIHGARTVINDRFLKKIELFSDMSESVLKDIVSDLVPRDYAEGEFLVNEGDDAYEFFAITSGEVSIQVAGVGEVRRLGRGDYLGEVALINESKRTASVVATAPVSVFTLTRDRFLKHVLPSDKLKTADGYVFNQMHNILLLSQKELAALVEDCEEFLADEPDNAYFIQLLRNAKQRLSKKKQEDNENSEKAMSNWWGDVNRANESRIRNLAVPGAVDKQEPSLKSSSFKLQRFKAVDRQPNDASNIQVAGSFKMQRFGAIGKAEKPRSSAKLQKFKSFDGS